MALARCCGTTRKGLRCSITASSRLSDDGGRLIGAPLQRGGKYCRLHSQPFCALPADELVGAAVVLLFDLETTGVDVATDQVVEFAAHHAPTTYFGQCHRPYCVTTPPNTTMLCGQRA